METVSYALLTLRETKASAISAPAATTAADLAALFDAFPQRCIGNSRTVLSWFDERTDEDEDEDGGGGGAEISCWPSGPDAARVLELLPQTIGQVCCSERRVTLHCPLPLPLPVSCLLIVSHSRLYPPFSAETTHLTMLYDVCCM
jgi:hypothetical protein